MPIEQQQTLARSFTVEGVGIHTGTSSRVTVHPADEGTGRVFTVEGHRFPAQAGYVLDTTRCTTLGCEGIRLHTVEHLLSALFAYGIDNALIEVEGREIPILDGSALPYAQALEQSGIIGQKEPARVLTLETLCKVEDRGSVLEAHPNDSLQVEAQVDFNDWPEGNASQTYEDGEDSAATYLREIAPARTFAFKQEVEQLLAAGLARGGSLDNALIITPPDTFSTLLRLPREWCAHKLLDVLGDLALLNVRPRLTLTAFRPGHGSNVRLVRALLEQGQLI